MLVFLITVVVGLLIAGVLIWAIDAFPWIDANFKQAAKVVLVVIFVLWLLSMLLGYVPAFAFPHVK